LQLAPPIFEGSAMNMMTARIDTRAGEHGRHGERARHGRWRRRAARAALLLAIGTTFGFTCDSDDDAGTPVWANWGGDIRNTHHAASERVISPETVADLQPRWTVRTTGNVSAIPTLSTTRVYVPDWGPLAAGAGQLYAIDRASGDVVSKRGALDYTHNVINSIVRTSPAIAGDLLVFGDIRSQPSSVLAIPGGHGAVLYAINRVTGDLVWRTTLDPHPLAIVTQSPTIHDGVVYVGVSSFEEGAARLGYDCCSFRGSMAAVDLATGAIRWQTVMTPPAPAGDDGFTGAAVWGSSPAIDVARRLVYIATGNNYTFPANLEACVAAHAGNAEAQQRECYDPLDPVDNLAEAVVALDLDTGIVRWSRKMHNYGAWTFACDPDDLVPWLPANPDNCEDLDALDYDFGQAPMLITTADGARRDLVVVGQKDGVFWAFDPDSGATVWATPVGPGGILGGMEFGAATDGERIYTQITNFDHSEFPLVAGPYAGQTVRGGIWAALDVDSGQLLWQTPDPASFQPIDGDIAHPYWGGGLGPGYFGAAKGPMTVANGVVFAGSMDRAGHMYGFDARTGVILWSFASGGSVMSAPSIADGVLYWGSGYTTGYNNNAIYAFAIPGLSP
jgi:polyvinyl alcohol dehydrogenase (cytochrome)